MSAPKLPRDRLCRWLGNRWETMRELAIALERESAQMQLEMHLGKVQDGVFDELSEQALRRVRKMLDQANRGRS